MTDHADTSRTEWPLTREQHYALLAERDRLTLALGLMTSERDALLAERQQDQRVIAKLQREAYDVALVLDQTRAERQQAQEERERAIGEREAVKLELRQLDKDVSAEIAELRDQRQQAVDALREIAATEPEFGFRDDWQAAYSGALVIARAALVKLGEAE